MRIEVNISLRKKGERLGTKVEIKNLNSFRSVERAIAYEIERQKRVLNNGEGVVQETRGWDEGRQRTFSQRQKEESHDYRYFPEPDLPPLFIDKEEEFKNLIAAIPELPAQKRERFKKEYGLPDGAIKILTDNKELADYFEEAVSETRSSIEKNFGLPEIKIIANYLTSDLLGLMKEKYLDFNSLRTTPRDFAHLLAMVINGTISSRVAKNLLREMVEKGEKPHQIVQQRGLEQTSDREFINLLCKKAISENPKAVADFKKGKETALQFLMGTVMRESKGKTDPKVVNKVLKELLKSGL
jgi:aspartyl-tRNA(Asn)/glutamyl-tRNA(Gln) amidotransferase subunit B